MLFSLEVMQAKKGDCLILHYGDKTPRFILVDGGPAGVYAQSLRPRLDELRAGPCNNGTVLLDLLIVTHIDDDHIRGVLDLMDRLRDGVTS